MNKLRLNILCILILYYFSQVVGKTNLLKTSIQKSLSNSFVSLKSQTKTFTINLEKLKKIKLRSKTVSKLHPKVKVGRYLAKLYVGTPPQEITALIDTGSTVFFITSIFCHQNKDCKIEDYFNHEKSKTFSKINKNIKIQYSAGNLTGTLGNEDIVINNINVKNQTLALLQEYKSDNTFDHVGALIGISYPIKGESPNGNFFENMIQQKLLEKNVIGYYINFEKRIGSMSIGYIDESHYLGKLNQVPVTGDNRWTVKVDQILINDKPTTICSERIL